MTIAWILCYLLVGTLLLAVAFGADRVAASLRLSRRAVWSCAMLAMCIMPLFLRQITPFVSFFAYSGIPPGAVTTHAPAIAASPKGSRPVAVQMPVLEFNVTAGPGNRVLLAPDSPVMPLDRWAMIAWCIGTIVYAALLFVAWRRMREARLRWTTAPAHIAHTITSLTGASTRVLCSDNIGPAAFGVIRPAVVIPRWALTLDAEALDLLLRHEASHVTARDPLLLRVTLASVIAMPWNLPLLIAYRRLHRAVEHDCDARVVASTHDARGYARLLLETASRFAGAGAAQAWSRAAGWLPGPVSGIGTRRSELEARLRALAHPIGTWQSRVRLVGATALMVAGVLAACSVPSPERTRIDTGGIQSRVGDRDVAGSVSRTSPTVARAAQPTTALDSVAMMETAAAEFPRMTPRGRALQDSLVEVAVREAVPQAFQFKDSVVDLFVLLDAQYRVERFAIGPQYYSVRRDAFDGDTVSQPATRATPRSRMWLDEAAYLRAFPGVTRNDIHRGGGVVEVKRGVRSVQVMWLRRAWGEQAGVEHSDVFLLSDVLLRSQRSWTFSDQQRQTLQSLRQRMLGSLALEVAPAIFDTTSKGERFMWLLMDGQGSIKRFAIDRGVVNAAVARVAGQEFRARDARSSAPARETDLCAAFSTKFGTLDPQLVPSVCGVDTVSNGWRHVPVVWGFANVTN